MRNSIKVLFIAAVLLLVLSVLRVFAEEKDSDLDGIPDSMDKYPFDYDNDGMPDLWEKKYGLRYDMNDAYEDPDNDRIKNIDEYLQGTDPLFSEKTRERVSPELLTPVEITMVRGLIWAGSLLFFFIIGGLVLYRTHIFRIFKFIHHISREHLEQHAIKNFDEKKAAENYSLPHAYRGRDLASEQRNRGYRYPRVVLRQRPITREVPKPMIRRFAKPTLPQEKVRIGEKPKVYSQPKEYQESYLKEKESFEKIGSDMEEKKPEDVFGRLSKYAHEYKQRENLREN